MYFWGIYFMVLICLPDHNNNAFQLPLSKKIYSQRYELPIFALAMLLPVGGCG